MVLQEYWRSLQGEAADTRGVAFAEGYVGDLRRLIEGAGIGGAGPPRRARMAGRLDAAAAWLVNGVLAVVRA